ncbi:type III-B CRISPR module RAMP protein Cmr4 [Nocardiopsis coralliicola]
MTEKNSLEFLLYLYTESPLHAGGPEPDSWIDLPIQREAGTGYPVVWGQSLKGALRAQARREWDSSADVSTVFGTASGDDDVPGDTAAGSLTVGDAQLVAMPVPTLQRTFAWATSALALGRLHRKYRYLLRGTEQNLPASPDNPELGKALSLSAAWVHQNQILGPYAVHVESGADHPGLADWARAIAADGLGGSFSAEGADAEEPLDYFARRFAEDLLLVDPTVMSGLLRECTEQAVRVSLDPGTKTVQAGPFTSEYLPAESVLAATLTLRLRGDDSAERARMHGLVRTLLHDAPIQIGGDETLGKGLTWARLVEAHRA